MIEIQDYKRRGLIPPIFNKNVLTKKNYINPYLLFSFFSPLNGGISKTFDSQRSEIEIKNNFRQFLALEMS